VTDIEALYRKYLAITDDPGAAATLVLAEVTAGDSTNEWLTPTQAAARLNVSRFTIYEMCQQRKLRHKRVGRTIRIRQSDLAEFASDSETTPKLMKFKHLKL
jgi:excisionase family DNA binding protein